MDLLDVEFIKRIEDRLLEVLKVEYEGFNDLWLRVDEAKISYWDKPQISLIVCFGNDVQDQNLNWDKKVEFYLISDDLEFIAGQFVQYLIDHDM